MRRITLILILVGILLTHGCKKAAKPAEPLEAKVYAPKAIEQLEVDWDELADRVRSHSELQEQLDAFIKKHTQSQETVSTKEALKRAYARLSDSGTAMSRAKISAASDALKLFIRLDATEVIREGVLQENYMIVGVAAAALADQADRGVKDRAALPYLIYVLAKNIERPGGSDTSSVLHRLALAIQKITDLDIEVSTKVAESTKEANAFVSLARDWAKANGVKLLD
jgi:hypothetical protein